MPKNHQKRRHQPEPSPRKSRGREITLTGYFEEPRIKTWSVHDLIDVRPLTQSQERMFRAFEEGNHIIAYGSAGTGKTLIAFYLALNEILYPNSPTNNIIIVRSAVQSRDLGFMKGDLEEKTSLYENPYRDILYELVGKFSSYDEMKKAGLITFNVTSFVRGLTWDNAIVILDEIQNYTFQEIHSVLTRLGDNSRLIALGDTAQNDLLNKKNEVSGMERFLRVVEKMQNVAMIQFTRDDIVRSEFVRDWIVAVEETQ